MPLYEYLCEADGTRLELIRPMRDADAPVEDPEGRQRKFARVMSMPMLSTPKGETSSPSAGGACGCGRRQGGCGH